MRAIDTHCHASPYWFEPIEVMIHQMELNSVEKSLLVQFFGVYDNDYLIQQAETYPQKFRVAGLVDHTKNHAKEEIETLSSRGVRPLDSPLILSPRELTRTIFGNVPNPSG